MFSKWSYSIVVVIASLFTLAPAAHAAGFITDDLLRKPPAAGVFTYGVWGPQASGFPTTGEIYGPAGDPRFGGKVRRITSEFPNASKSDIYSKNGFWSADGRLMFHLTSAETKTIVNTDTGASVEVPGDYDGFDGSFAPDDAGGTYTWYFFSGTQLMKYSLTLTADGTPVVASGPATVEDFGVRLGGLGGSVDWIDNSGRYMVLNVGGVMRVWDRMARTFYADPPAPVSADAVVLAGGWIGISPDGRYVVVSTDDGSGIAGGEQQYSFEVVHPSSTAAGMLEPGVLFWTLCGGHGDLVTASDGSTYLVTFDCYGSSGEPMLPAIYAVNVAPSTPVTGNDPLDEAGRNAQRQANRKLFEVAWGDDAHFSGVSAGLLRDWAFVSMESAEDTFGRDVRRSPWWNRPYMQEIVMVNVITCQVVRLAHHRSRSVGFDYYAQPRVSASWGFGDATTAAWLSNFGQLAAGGGAGQSSAGSADIYAIDVTPLDLPATTATCR
jgi:hypothetical protein